WQQRRVAPDVEPQNLLVRILCEVLRDRPLLLMARRAPIGPVLDEYEIVARYDVLLRRRAVHSYDIGKHIEQADACFDRRARVHCTFEPVHKCRIEALVVKDRSTGWSENK